MLKKIKCIVEEHIQHNQDIKWAYMPEFPPPNSCVKQYGIVDPQLLEMIYFTPQGRLYTFMYT